MAKHHSAAEVQHREPQRAKFLGTVYVPSDELTVGGDRDGDGVCDIAAEDDQDDEDNGGSKCSTGVGALSDWTAIIAQTLNIKSAVKLVLNSDYASSTVPVPAGIGPPGEKLIAGPTASSKFR